MPHHTCIYRKTFDNDKKKMHDSLLFLVCLTPNLKIFFGLYQYIERPNQNKRKHYCKQLDTCTYSKSLIY